ncbi:MAG: Fic family protein [bacterium F083]|nr:MAG: Fic family protein [bacterium P201]KWW38216.1 MAG: Fic family protein [bacterium F083]
MAKEQHYIDFDEYIRQGEPDKVKRADAWRVAIGLQAVDGLTTSDYLNETARRNIEGEINIDEARQLVKTYYQKKTTREPDDDEKQEADEVSGNISKLLQTDAFTYSVAGFAAIHKAIFDGVFKHAGRFRDYDITKKEWVLRGDTVQYARWQDLRMTLQYDLDQERLFDYTDLNKDQMVEHIAKFVSGLWEIHPFGEGNTRTTAVFTIKYLRSLGFDVNNDLFEQNSWYFRNALVRANYRNLAKGVNYDPVFLVRFFRNLLLGDNNVLKNRYMIINPPEEWKMLENGEAPDKLPDKLPDKFDTDNDYIKKLIKVVGNKIRNDEYRSHRCPPSHMPTLA